MLLPNPSRASADKTMSHDGSERKSGEHRPRRWKRLAVILAIIIIIIGLGLGLGLGIGLRSGDDDDDDGDAEPEEKWQPEVGASWQIILRYPMDLSDPDTLTPDVEVYDLDLYNNEAEVFAELQSMGKRVICYFSAGSYEDYRPDSTDFVEEDLGEELDGWPGERWVNVSSPRVRGIMATRIELASQKGCDAIDPDNVDGFQNENGLDLTPEDSVSFVRFLSTEAAKYKLAIGLKNAGDIIPDVISDVDFAVNEECAAYEECDVFAQFIEADKPVFRIEYPEDAPEEVEESVVEVSCEGPGSDGFSTVLKTLELDGWVQYCDGKNYDTATLPEEE